MDLGLTNWLKARAEMVFHRKNLAMEAYRELVPIVNQWVKARSQEDPLTGHVLFTHEISVMDGDEDPKALSSILITSFNKVRLTLSIAEKAPELSLIIDVGDESKVLADHVVRIDVSPGQATSARLTQKIDDRTFSEPIDFERLLGKFQDVVLKVG